MKVTLLGHASVLVEAGPMRILIDLVFQDPFESGMVVSCPNREIRLECLPPIDVVVISHRHPDHFDLGSLDRIASVDTPDPLTAVVRWSKPLAEYELPLVIDIWLAMTLGTALCSWPWYVDVDSVVQEPTRVSRNG